jgi:hypothetical protein
MAATNFIFGRRGAFRMPHFEHASAIFVPKLRLPRAQTLHVVTI